MTFENYLRTKNLSENTKSVYLDGVKTFHKLGYKSLDIRSLLAYKAELLEKFAPQTVNLRVVAMNRYCEYKGRSEKVALVTIQESAFVDNCLTETEYYKLLDGLLTDSNIQWYLIIRLLAVTGLRISEAMQITAEDIRAKKTRVFGKGSKFRDVYFPSKFRNEVEPYLTTGKIIRFESGYIRTKLKSLEKKYHIKCNLHPHEFRAFFARQYYKKTKDLAELRGLLGHSSIKTTARYIRKATTGMTRKVSKIVDW